MDRLMVNICSSELQVSKDFYVSLFDFKVEFESDWFINLRSDSLNVEIGIIDPDHEIVPEGAGVQPGGFYLTFVVKDFNEIYQRIIDNEIPIISQPHNTFYGQKRMIVSDPNGIHIDISCPIVT